MTSLPVVAASFRQPPRFHLPDLWFETPLPLSTARKAGAPPLRPLASTSSASSPSSKSSPTSCRRDILRSVGSARRWTTSRPEAAPDSPVPRGRSRLALGPPRPFHPSPFLGLPPLHTVNGAVRLSEDEADDPVAASPTDEQLAIRAVARDPE